MNKDFFLGIGAQRSGTTWLGTYCTDHPQIGFTVPKELHYFDAVYCPELCSDRNAGFRKELDIIQKKSEDELGVKEKAYRYFLEQRLKMLDDERLYVSYIQSFDKEAYRVLGEISPSYCLLDENGFRAIRNLIPQTKFVFLLRDPIDRFWSQLRFEQLKKKEPFDARDNVAACLQNEHFIRRTDYQRTLEALGSVVNESEICVLFYEHLFSLESTKSELKRFCDFLQVDYIEGTTERRVNRAPGVELTKDQASTLATHFTHIYDFVFSNFPDRIPERWRKSYENRFLVNEYFF